MFDDFEEQVERYWIVVRDRASSREVIEKVTRELEVSEKVFWNGKGLLKKWNWGLGN